LESLDKDVRILIEKQSDEFFNAPEEWRETARVVLSEQGILSNIETILSLFIGITLGEVSMKYKTKFKESWKKSWAKDAPTIASLLARRAFELRQHFVATEFR